MNKWLEDLKRSTEFYLIYFFTIIYIFFFFTFEIDAMNYPGVDMEVAGLTLTFKLFLTIAFLFLGWRLRDIDGENKHYAIWLLILSSFAIVPSATRMLNLIPVVPLIVIALYILIKYRKLENTHA